MNEHLDDVPVMSQWIGSDTPDLNDQLEELLLDKARTQNEILGLLKTDLSNTINSRKSLKWSYFGLVCLWLIFTAVVLIGNRCWDLQLADGVLIALLTGGSAQVVSLLLVVASHIYSKHGPTLTAEILTALDNRPE